MDLYAYSQIGNIEEIARANNIEVPRLRGYRLMKYDPKWKVYKDDIVECVFRGSVESNFGKWPWSEYSERTRRWFKKYGIEMKEGTYTYYMPNWNALHGKKRKYVKFEIKKMLREYQNQVDTHNKYVGRDDVLFIHARIGGGNWEFYDGPELTKKDWFIEKVDDVYDGTYCDIYARIMVKE